MPSKHLVAGSSPAGSARIIIACMTDKADAEAYRRRDEIIEMAVRLANNVITEHCQRDFIERAIVTATAASRLSDKAVFWLNHELAKREFEKDA